MDKLKQKYNVSIEREIYLPRSLHKLKNICVSSMDSWLCLVLHLFNICHLEIAPTHFMFFWVVKWCLFVFTNIANGMDN